MKDWLQESIFMQEMDAANEQIEQEKELNQFCFNCGHRIIGYGCTKDSRTHPIHVKDHDTCEKWVHKQTVGTINHEQDLYDNRLKGA